MGAGVGVSFLFSKKDYHHTKKHLFFLTSKNIFQTFSKHFPTPLETLMSLRRITPTYAAEAYANPLFHSDLPLVAPTLVRTDTIHDGGLSRQNTMVIEPPTEDSDTEVIPEVEYKYTDCNHGDVVGMGIPGFYRPQLGTEPFDDDVVEVSREVVQRRIAGAGIGVVRRARAQLGDIDTDSDDEDGLVPVKRPIRRPTTPKKSVKRKARFHADELTDDDDDDTTTVVRTAPTPVGRGQGNKSSRWCFTYNNPSMDGDEFVSLLESKGDIKMAVFQKEKGEEGTEHFQGYMETKKRMYTTGAHAMLNPIKMSLLHAKGTKQQNEKYCTKEEGRVDGPWYANCTTDDFKRKSGNQGKRSDLDEFARMIKEEGGITEDVFEAMPGHAMAYSKHAKALVAEMKLTEIKKKEMAYWQEQYQRRQRGEEIEGQQQRNLKLYFGPTAVGKTTEVKLHVMGELGVPLFEKSAATKWWDGYQGENHVLVDEYRGGQTIDEFKALTNIGEVAIEMKGTSGILVAEQMYFTTNCHPTQWWKRNAGEAQEYHNWSSQDYRAVARRFAEVHWWNDEKVKTVLTNPGPMKDTREWRRTNQLWRKFWEWRAPADTTGDNYFTLE